MWFSEHTKNEKLLDLSLRQTKNTTTLKNSNLSLYICLYLILLQCLLEPIRSLVDLFSIPRHAAEPQVTVDIARVLPQDSLVVGIEKIETFICYLLWNDESSLPWQLDNLTTWLGKNLAFLTLSRKRTFIISCLQEQLRNLYNQFFSCQ